MFLPECTARVRALAHLPGGWLAGAIGEVVYLWELETGVPGTQYAMRVECCVMSQMGVSAVWHGGLDVCGL